MVDKYVNFVLSVIYEKISKVQEHAKSGHPATSEWKALKALAYIHIHGHRMTLIGWPWP